MRESPTSSSSSTASHRVSIVRGISCDRSYQRGCELTGGDYPLRYWGAAHARAYRARQTEISTRWCYLPESRKKTPPPKKPILLPWVDGHHSMSVRSRREAYHRVSPWRALLYGRSLWEFCAGAVVLTSLRNPYHTIHDLAYFLSLVRICHSCFLYLFSDRNVRDISAYTRMARSRYHSYDSGFAYSDSIDIVENTWRTLLKNSYHYNIPMSKKLISIVIPAYREEKKKSW